MRHLCEADGAARPARRHLLLVDEVQHAITAAVDRTEVERAELILGLVATVMRHHVGATDGCDRVRSADQPSRPMGVCVCDKEDGPLASKRSDQ